MKFFNERDMIKYEGKYSNDTKNNMIKLIYFNGKILKENFLMELLKKKNYNK